MIPISVYRASAFWQKLKGLIGEEKAYPYLIKTRFGIHTFFLRFPIDVIVLDNEKRVIAYKKNLQSNSFYFWDARFDTVIELPAGFIENQGIHKGDRIALLSPL